jgi:hypothetical protein
MHQWSKTMAVPNLAAFRCDLETVKKDTERFVSFYGDVWYTYYYSEPPISVPDEVWRYVAGNDYRFEHADVASDRTACLFWQATEEFDKKIVERFKLLSKQCCLTLWDHKKLLATVAEIQTVVAGPSGYHQWIRLIHRIAADDPIWSGLIVKCLCVSQRPFDETRQERVITKPNEAEEQLIQRLREQGKSVPDIWSEHIKGLPPVVLQSHCHMLDVLYDLVQASYVSEIAEGDELTPLQKKFIASLDGKRLATEALCTELSNRAGKAYGSTGQMKGALSDLVKLDIMKNDGNGYELTDLGRRIEAGLPASIWTETRKKRKRKPPRR